MVSDAFSKYIASEFSSIVGRLDGVIELLDVGERTHPFVYNKYQNHLECGNV